MRWTLVGTRVARHVVAIRDDDQRLLAVSRRCASSASTGRWRRTSPCRRPASTRAERAIDAIAIRRPSLQQRRRAAEPHQEEFVVRATSRSTQEPIERRARGVESSRPPCSGSCRAAMPRLTGTRSALKCVTCCGASSSYTLKVLLLQAGHEPAAAVADGRGHVDQLDAALELESLRFLRTLRTDEPANLPNLGCRHAMPAATANAHSTSSEGRVP